MWWSERGEDFPQGDGITTYNWLGEEIDASAEEKDQKNARVTMPIRNVPHLDSDYSNNDGVPLDVALIGGRSSKLHPLISRARSWNEAVYHALCQFSEPTAAAVGQKPRYDPMANRPFIAFNVSDYAQKWLDIPEKTPNPPAVFSVNWFRRDDDGNFIWDGFGANYRVLDAAVRQCADTYPIIFDEIGKCDSTHTRVVDVWRDTRGAGGWSKCARNETRCVWGLCADFIRG